MFLRAYRHLALELFTLGGNLTSLLLGSHHVELITCGGGTVQTEYDGGFAGQCFLYALSAFVEHGTYLAVV